MHWTNSNNFLESCKFASCLLRGSGTKNVPFYAFFISISLACVHFHSYMAYFFPRIFRETHVLSKVCGSNGRCGSSSIAWPNPRPSRRPLYSAARSLGRSFFRTFPCLSLCVKDSDHLVWSYIRLPLPPPSKLSPIDLSFLSGQNFPWGGDSGGCFLTHPFVSRKPSFLRGRLRKGLDRDWGGVGGGAIGSVWFGCTVGVGGGGLLVLFGCTACGGGGCGKLSGSVVVEGVRKIMWPQ